MDLNLRTVVGLDVGRSAVKAVAVSNGQRYELVFPSIVTRAVPILDEKDRLAADRETVEVKSQTPGALAERYFTGEIARLYGNASSTVGLHDDWIDSPQYSALVISAKKRFAEMGVIGLEQAIVVVGSPSKLFHTQRGVMQHATYAAWQSTITVMSQPMGAYLSCFLDANGKAVEDMLLDQEGNKKSWAVIDIGHYTTDFLSLKEGANEQDKAKSCSGISLAVENLERELRVSRRINIDSLKGERALREKKVKYRGEYLNVENEVEKAVRPVVEEIIQHALTIFSKSIDDLDGILLAGGAADIVYSQLNAKWSHTKLLDNPRMAIAEGYCRYGLAAATEMAKQAANKVAA